MSRLALAAGAAAVVYGIGLTALGLRWWLAPSAPRTRIHTRTTTMMEPQLEQLQHDCPNCACCTAALCRRAAMSLLGCAAHTPAEHQATVAACPCSELAVAAASSSGPAWVGGPVPAGPPAAMVPASTEAGFLLGLDAAAPAGLVAVRQITTTAAVFLVQESAGVVRVAGGEPW